MAYYWTGFNNGGRANYGYYNEMWPPVVSEGSHGQLLEINSKDLPNGTDPDRVIGIAQRVWLQAGATYEISFDAQMREAPVAADEDAYRYTVSWGYSTSGTTDPAQMSFKEMVPLTTIYPRTEPGAMQSYSTRFTAPGNSATVAIWGLKKWATENRELDVNLDNVMLRLCAQPKPVHPIYPVHPVHPIYPSEHPIYPPKPVHPVVPPSKPAHGASCDEAAGDTWYQVQRGDTLSGIAAAYGATVADIMAKNNLSNPNVIYTGQSLCIPGQPVAVPDSESRSATPIAETAAVATAANQEPVQSSEAPAYDTEQPSQAVNSGSDAAEAASEASVHRVQRGDTLSAIAAQHGTTVQALVNLNNIADPNNIYTGQELRLR